MSNTKCNPTVDNPIDSVGSCAIDDSTPSTETGCVDTPNGLKCPPQNCSPWDLTTGPEDCLFSSYIEEQLNISGAVLKVHKLLGIHEQGQLQDVTGNGTAISSGALGNNPASNAFDAFITEWRSLQTGADVVREAFIGYDFGPIKLPNGRDRYGLPTEVMKDVSTLKIMQGCDKNNRVTKIRVERSENGKKWYGVQVLDVKDCDGIVVLNFKRSVPSRYWRIRPLAFNGSSSDYWVIRALQFVEFEATSLENIQDKILLENRDRDYQEFAVDIKAAYTPQENSTLFDRFGMNPFSDMYSFDVSFAQCVQRLGRPLVIGDILMVPSERQYSPTLRPIDKYLEVTDIFWSSSGFSPTWTPSVQKIIAKPLLASQETQDISGKLTVDTDNSGLFDLNDGNNGKKYQDYMDVSDNIRAHNKENVPVKGIDYAKNMQISDELKEFASKFPNMDVEKLTTRPRLIHGIDAMPPNGLPYTEGDEFPKSPNNGDYHRLTYKAIAPNIPARLHRYSAAKGRWIYLETDVRAMRDDLRPHLKRYTKYGSKTPLTDIEDELDK